MKIFSIETGNFKLDGGSMFGVVPKALWNKVYPADENNYASLAMRCLLIDTGEQKILIDTGIGTKQDEKFFGRYYLVGDDMLEKSLQSYGYQNKDITDVIFTHLHFDHCGGAIKYNENKQLVTTFPNAKYYIGKSHWELAMNPNYLEKASFLKENILPIQESGQLHFIEHEGKLYDHIEIKIFNGHTTGQLIPYIYANNRLIVFGGDVVALAAHIPMPWLTAFDTQPLISLKDKKRLLTDVLENNGILIFEHDMYTECCTLQKTEKGIRMKEILKLHEII